MAILATVAFNSRVDLADVDYLGITDVDARRRRRRARARHGDPARRRRASRRRRLRRPRPAGARRQAAPAGEGRTAPSTPSCCKAMRSARSRCRGPGAGGIETASAVIADMVSVIGTMGTGFLQNDAAWRQLPKLPPGENTLAVLLPPLGRGPPWCARARRRRARAARRLDRAAAAAAERQRRVAARRHPRGPCGRARRGAPCARTTCPRCIGARGRCR